MEKEITLSIYRDYKNTYDEKDLKELSSELSKVAHKSIQIITINGLDGEYLKVIVGNE